MTATLLLINRQRKWNNYMRQPRLLSEMCPNTEYFLVRIFPHSDWIRRDTKYLYVFSPNARKYGPENTPYLDIFHAVQDYLWECENQRTDVNRYDKVEGDLFIATNKNICKVLGNIIRKKEIDKKRANSLYIKRPQLCRFYLLPKIHKKNNKCTRKTCYFQ